MKNRWYAIERKGSVAEISIFDEIGFWGTPLAEFKKEFDAVRDSEEIRVLLNSPGGSVMDGMGIYNLLASRRDRVTVEVIGMAASIASVIALSGRELVMDEGTYLMIHNPWSFVIGDAEQMRKEAEVLDTIRGEMANIYAAHSSLSKDEALAAMDAETWYTAEAAADAGFVDRIEDRSSLAACAFDFQKYGFQHTPETLAQASEQREVKTERYLERTLRDAGYSREEAKAIVSRGFRAIRPRDAEEGGEELAASIRHNIKILTITGGNG